MEELKRLVEELAETAYKKSIMTDTKEERDKVLEAYKHLNHISKYVLR